jgi:hypothetical protein
MPRPTTGNEPFEVPIVRGWQIFQQALSQGSGLASRPRYVMSHATGKIEVVGLDHRYIYLRYHRAKDLEDRGRFMIFHRDDHAYWLDQLIPAAEFHLPPGLHAVRRDGNKHRRDAHRHDGTHRVSHHRHRAADPSLRTFEGDCPPDID